jgi:hypothetical protein
VRQAKDGLALFTSRCEPVEALLRKEAEVWPPSVTCPTPVDADMHVTANAKTATRFIIDFSWSARKQNSTILPAPGFAGLCRPGWLAGSLEREIHFDRLACFYLNRASLDHVATVPENEHVLSLRHMTDDIRSIVIRRGKVRMLQHENDRIHM